MSKALLLFVALTSLVQIPASGSEILIGLTNQVWRYYDTGERLADGWQSPEHDDSSWLEGRGIFAAGENSTGNANLDNNVYLYTNTMVQYYSAGWGVHYFRTRFVFTGDPGQVAPVASNLIDDGYVIYLNGREVSRYNINTNNETWYAGLSNPAGEGVYVVRELSQGGLVEGENVLAVAVYQTFIADMVWGTVLHSSAGQAPVFTSTTNDVSISVLQGRSTNLSVSVTGAPAPALQWFKDGEAVYGANSAIYPIPLMTAEDEGTYWCVASNGLGTAVSASVTVDYIADSFPPLVMSASARLDELGYVTVRFSEEVVNATDQLAYYLEEVWNPTNTIEVWSVVYGASSNVVVLTVAGSLDPAVYYNLRIINHYIEDRFGNPLDDPTVVRVTVPSMFQNGRAGYIGTQDTEIHQAKPATAFGEAAAVTVDMGDPVPYHAQGLLRFDGIFGWGPGQVPRGIIITKATLRLYTSDSSSGNSPVRVLRMLVPWDEQSTWGSLGNGIDQTNGVETASTDGLIVGTPDETFDELDVTATVQAWADGEPNYGWAFLPTGNDGWDFASSEHGTVMNRPALIVDGWYDPPPCAIEEDPQSTTVWGGDAFTLSVVAFGHALEYQWFKNNEAIPGARSSTYYVSRATPADSGTYFVAVTTPIPAMCISGSATVTVVCEDRPLGLVSAIGNADQTTITLSFNDGLDAGLAQNVTNYAISGGLSIVGVVHLGNQVILTNAPGRELGRNYSVTVRNLQDNGACSNTIWPNPTTVMLTQDVRVLSFESVWRYENNGLDMGTGWRQPEYEDAGWLEGPGLLGFETGEATLSLLSNQNLAVRTVLSRNGASGNQIITDYFRTIVNVPFYTMGVTFKIRHVVDEGAVFYFNGTEVARFNMPTGEVNWATTAVIAPGEGVVRSIEGLTGFSQGLNRFAVEVHQQSPVSADVLFGAELIARVPRFFEDDGRLTIARNADGTATISWALESAVLQDAGAVLGPWSDVAGAVSGIRIPISVGNRFYRLR